MIEALKRLTEAFAAGDLDTCAALTSNRWRDPAARPSEPSPADHIRTVGADLRAALDDWEITIEEPVEQQGTLSARLRAAATFSKDLWKYPANGRRVSFEAKIHAEPEGERLLWWLDEWVPVLVLRSLGIIPEPEFMDRPLAYPIVIPDAVLKYAFNGGFFEKPCSHLGEMRVTEPTARRCLACDEAGVEYPAVRMCVTCGHVGCCDASKNKHALKHHQETGHPLIRSVHLAETWMWCYPDKTILSAKW